MDEQDHYDLIQRPSQPYFSLVHAFNATMGGFSFCGTEFDDTPTAEESLFELSRNPRFVVEVPNFDTLTYIVKNFPHILTDIPEEEILDRAESGGLSKALLIFQVAWFCTNCASRLNQRLPLSLLEVSTAAHAFCTLLTYFVWWSKPLNVAAPTIVRRKEAREVYALIKCSDEEYDKALEMAQKRAAGEFSTGTGTHTSEKIVRAAHALQSLLPTPVRPPKHSRSPFRDHSQMFPGAPGAGDPSGSLFWSAIAISISAALYGFVHFLAWSDQFPTPLERLLWRVASIVVTSSGLMEVFVLLLMRLLDFLDSRLDPANLGFIMCVFVIPATHMLASGFLVVESFRQLVFLDPAAYQLPSWPNYWPHLS